jgi:hypothetical protein
MFHIRTTLIGLGAVAIIGTGLVGGGRVNAAAPRAVGNSPARASLPGFQIGKPHSISESSWLAYYDGHKDTSVYTDVSNKSQAKSLAINFAPILSHSLGASSPMYFVKGRAAAGQIAVFGSEPGESDYSPLWREIWVTWKPGAKMVLLKRDDQIDALAKAGKLTKRMTNIVLNAPVTSVGH